MTVRPYAPADEAAVRAIFRATLALGRPLPFLLPGLDAYERLCLDWFLGPGAGDAGVLTDGHGRVRGYLLLCTDLVGLHRWATPAASAWAAATVARLAAGRLRGDAARFHRLRLRDGYTAWRHAPDAPMPGYVHLNLDPGVRAGIGGRLLSAHADTRCRLAGLPGWYGEMNARRGTRAAALAAGGLEIVHREPNLTLSWLAGAPVDRLTVVRDLAHDPARLGRHPSHRPGLRRSPSATAS